MYNEGAFFSLKFKSVKKSKYILQIFTCAQNKRLTCGKKKE